MENISATALEIIKRMQQNELTESVIVCNRLGRFALEDSFLGCCYIQSLCSPAI